MHQRDIRSELNGGDASIFQGKEIVYKPVCGWNDQEGPHSPHSSQLEAYMRADAYACSAALRSASICTPSFSLDWMVDTCAVSVVIAWTMDVCNRSRSAAWSTFSRFNLIWQKHTHTHELKDGRSALGAQT